MIDHDALKHLYHINNLIYSSLLEKQLLVVVEIWKHQ